MIYFCKKFAVYQINMYICNEKYEIRRYCHSFQDRYLRTINV